MTIISISCFRQNTCLTKLLTLHSMTWWIQGLSRNCGIKFKDFQAPVLFSGTFKALNLREKNSSTFKDVWEPCEIPQVLQCFYGFTAFHACQFITFIIITLSIHHCSTLLHHATHLFHHILSPSPSYSSSGLSGCIVCQNTVLVFIASITIVVLCGS